MNTATAFWITALSHELDQTTAKLEAAAAEMLQGIRDYDPMRFGATTGLEVVIRLHSQVRSLADQIHLLKSLDA